jgi:hypothetical protein
VDWIEQQLQSYGCTTERLYYEFDPPARAPLPAGVTATPAAPRPPLDPVIASGEVRRGPGGSRYRGTTRPTGVNKRPLAAARRAPPRAQPRARDQRAALAGLLHQVGSTRPHEMYIVSAHMDGHGWGEAANDNGSGTALVMEEPLGSGLYPEPKWLGMIQHDMMLWDHGMPRADGTWNPEQRPEADVNIEFQSTALRADEAMRLAFFFRDANERYATDYPAAVGPHMTNTDSTPFMDLTPAISLRENERGMHTGAGWNPTWHQPIDVFTTFSDKDFRLGLNAAQTTLSAVGQLAGARLTR